VVRNGIKSGKPMRVSASIRPKARLYAQKRGRIPIYLSNLGF
jgi:hypothetical protein